MTTLALVAHSARMLSEAAQRDGYGAIAIDLFGDSDTRRASRRWLPAAAAGSPQLDAALVLAALRDIARNGEADGWIAGGGCEGQPALLAAGADMLPLFGTAPAAIARVRDPLAFFGFLAAHGIAHPEVRSTQPARPQGWLRKDAHGCGGLHIRDAADVNGIPMAASHYFQRRAAGTPMSATFIGNGIEAGLLGCNELIVHPFGVAPFVYCGAIGPVAVPDAVLRDLRRTLRLLTAGFALQGLSSLDFMLDGEQVLVLEVNPRPPATMALYGRGVFGAHLDACLRGTLPAQSGQRSGTVCGHQIVYSPGALRIDRAAAARLAAWPGCHDLPAAPASFAAHDPLCSLSAAGDSPARVRSRLHESATALLLALENP